MSDSISNSRAAWICGAVVASSVKRVLIVATVAEKNELLFQHGVNFNDLPLWQKRGIGLYWEEYDRPAENPVTGEKVLARRRRIRRDLELPMKGDYSAFLRKLIAVSQGST